MKDFCRKLGKDPDQIIMVEDTVASGFFWLECVVPIVPFTTDKSDRELVHLKDFLKALSRTDKHSEALKQYFKLHVLANEPRVEDALAALTV